MKTRSAPKSRSRERSRTSPAKRRAAKAASTRSQRARPGAKRARSGGRGAAAQLTTDHEEIRHWVEERGGQPATVKRSIKPNQRAGILRIDFPGFSAAVSLKAVSWEDWFDTFERNRLGFLHQDHMASGKPSRFNKIVCRR